MRFLRKILHADASLPPQTAGGHYARLITENLPYIERQCRRAVLQSSGDHGDRSDSASLDAGAVDNECDELLNEVLDHLKADDFKALRSFKGEAKITTYITTIISNLIVDLVRQKKGRSRARERARDMGTVGERLYDLVFGKGFTLQEAHSHLEITHGITETLENLQQMLEHMRGRSRPQVAVAAGEGEVWLVPGRRMLVDDVAEIVVVDPRKNSEALLIAHQNSSRAREAVSALIGELSGEERLLIRMRFPDDCEEEPKSIREIADLLGATERSVDARIRRVLARMKEVLLQRGLALNDFIDV